MRAIGGIDEKAIARGYRDASRERQALDILREDSLWQAQPEKEAARGMRPLDTGGHELFQRGERAVAARFVERAHVRDVFFPGAAQAVFGNHAGRERIRAAS